MHIYLCDRANEMTSDKLIREFLKDYIKEKELNISEQMIADSVIEYNLHGKPYFIDLPQIHFSVSHSGACWACAFDSAPIGLDIENLRRRRTKAGNNQRCEHWEGIAKRYFTQQEYEFIQKGGEDSFFMIWVRKEAYLKYKGIGIASGLSDFNLVEGNQLLNQLPDAYIKPIDLCPHIFAACCSFANVRIEKNVCLCSGNGGKCECDE